jgi:hypothetical protein
LYLIDKLMQVPIADRANDGLNFADKSGGGPNALASRLGDAPGKVADVLGVVEVDHRRRSRSTMPQLGQHSV